MKFILWTVAYWGLFYIERRFITWPTYGGPENFMAKFGGGVIAFAGLINWVLYIFLYVKFVK